MTVDKWIVLAVAIAAIIWLNVNFIRRMNRRARDVRNAHAAAHAPKTEPQNDATRGDAGAGQH
jgi:hypothetical protein